MITDAHNRIRKYNRHIEDHKATCLRVLGTTLFEQLEAAIERKVRFTTEKKRENLNRKISKLTMNQQQNTNNHQAWIKNLSSRNLTNKEEEVLIKGLNFNFKDANKLEYLASLEAILTTSNLTEDVQQNIRQTIIPVITRNRTYNTLSKDEKQAMDNLKHDSNIVILPADKGRMTVVLDKPDYINKAKALLNDTNTYRRLQEDHCKKLGNQINATLKKLKDSQKITREEQWKMRPGDPRIALFYGLPKVHKEGIPLRPIVSLPGTPTYNLSKELWKRLKYLISGSQYSIHNAQQFLDKLSGIHIDEDEIMVSFDVTSLFTSIDLKTAKETISELLDVKGTPNGLLTKEDIGELLNLCLTTYFTFDGEYYEQLKGAPMGSPISGLIAETMMQKLESIVLPSINPKLWVRYIDDTFTIIKKNELERTIQTLNSVFDDINFTMETEKNSKLAFLDVLVTRTFNEQLETCVYRKETHTDQILHYESNHPKCHKESCI